MEQTLSIIKPDGVANRHIGDIIKQFESSGLKIVAMKMIHLSKKEARGFYAVHKARPFFDSLTDFMSSGPAIAIVLEGEDAIARNREFMGATDPKDAAGGTIRSNFATDKEKNAVHGSDASETAVLEIAYFFSKLEIVG
ncbi:MAG: nucleoside-diphosphate kinase [Proteobacteria bacterium]|nr:nucleoside-diphosphate kinase [Pseudomonadota bacterium]